jgi:hypothetical protein
MRNSQASACTFAVANPQQSGGNTGSVAERLLVTFDSTAYQATLIAWLQLPQLALLLLLLLLLLLQPAPTHPSPALWSQRFRRF